MKKIVALLLILVAESSVAGLRMDDGSLIKPGDNIDLLYAQWGRENQRLTSEKTCNHIISLKKEYCSTRRLIWQRNGRYIRVQVSGRMIIKTGWTRSRRELTKSF